jgi:hypothetical protein
MSFSRNSQAFGDSYGAMLQLAGQTRWGRLFASRSVPWLDNFSQASFPGDHASVQCPEVNAGQTYVATFAAWPASLLDAEEHP